MSTLLPTGLPASSTLPVTHEFSRRPVPRSQFTLVVPLVASLLAILGLATIASAVFSLWALWTTDALKSIGMVVPLVSFILILRVWRSLGWEVDGSWWGFALLVATALLVRFRDQSLLILVLAPQWNLYFPPNSLVLCLYATGLVLLFGGPRLLRACTFPLVLLLFSNPVPHVFNVWVDLPLQRASAHVARSFAMALGQPLTPDKLRLMFTPDFGMFIAPGCNGIRGAVTMGFIALVAGYLYRFRWKAHAAVVIGAILLGYLFNFIRLCVLVLYYVLALHVTSLQQQGENADYLIGGTLFFIAVFLLYTIIQKLGASPAHVHARPPIAPPSLILGNGFYVRAAAMAVLAAAGLSLLVHSLRSSSKPPALLAEENRSGSYPQTVGPYTRVRAWNETLETGTLLFHWAEYAPTASSGTHISIGLSPVLGSHDTLICHSARGEDPLWHGQQTLQTATEPVNFSTAFYNDGATEFLEATTLCNGSSCGEYSTQPAHLGFVWSKPHPQALFNQNPERPIPILLRAETTDTTLPTDIARRQLSNDVASFVAAVDLDRLTAPYRSR